MSETYVVLYLRDGALESDYTLNWEVAAMVKEVREVNVQTVSQDVAATINNRPGRYRVLRMVGDFTVSLIPKVVVIE